MYSFLAGVLAEKSPTVITIDVGGIGFQLLVPLSTSQKLPEVGEKVKVLTHHVVREDAQLLFGFLSEEERALFKLLLGVSGIGPKSALTILSGLGIRELKKAIVQGSVLALTAIPGIGRKTAERLIIELREKIVIEGRLDPEGIPVILSKHEALAQDSLRALVSLGYSKQDAKAAIQKVLSQKGNDRLNAESLIRESLKQILYV